MTSKTRSGEMTLGPFLEDLGKRLDQMSAEDLKKLILAIGGDLPPRARAPFLLSLDRTEQRSPDEPLMDEIEDLLGRIRAGDFYEGWGWDREIHAERGFGDESWASEMDMLFDDAGAAFRAGNMDLAKRAYGRLLHAIWGGEEAEQLSGAEDPTELLQTDLREAAGRYLRALYETTPDGRRAKHLMAEMDDMYLRPTLGELREARQQDLPGLAGFLPGWIELLQSEPSQFHGGDVRRLLTEAVLLRDGTDGLAALARSQGVDQPEIYLELVLELERAGEAQRAATAASEALAAPVPAGEVRARIADRLAGLGANRTDRLEARREAWRARASKGRLLAMVDAARQLGNLPKILEGESQRLPTVSTRRESDTDERLACALLLMAGRIDHAVDRALAAADNWSDYDHPGYLLVPFLLLAGAGASEVPEPASVLRALLNEADRESWRSSNWGMVTNASDDDPIDGEDPQTPSGRVPMLSELLAEYLPVDASPASRAKWFAAGRKLIESGVAEVVKAQRRRSYEKVARLVVAGGEALALTDASEGAAYVEAIQSKYPRHTAFRGELEKLCRVSALLPSSPRRR